MDWLGPIRQGRLEERLLHFGKPRLLIMGKLGYLPFEPDAAHLFFHLVSRRYERGSMLVTSNRAVGEWGGVFGDPVVATSAVDSYQLREKHCSGLLRTAAPKPATPLAKQ